MAKHNTKPEVSISKALRRLKVGYTSIRHADRNDMTTYYSRCPSLNLKGNWLEEAGFATDTPVTVAVEHGQLIIQRLTE
ncbi:SymE family type I addiction module toxin [Rosenbergiella nectarea]|uniref:SymE family type I addiction module toxin n=1 Tax=Rosenbergiella nectarea TaxID=988801 RepID=UPI001F4EBBD1|nr:SymE family type I addiction module toxin [Rosenbergiella nectarea]